MIFCNLCTVHLYSHLLLVVSGHEWVKNNLGIIPKTGWSIDPFGHGPTVPYMLDKSGLEGTIIQRIHYAWKQWLAKRQIEEFHWMPGWSSKKPSLIVHNMPFDIYSIKASCGPHPSVCLSYDFRKIPGEYSEYTAKHEEITEENVYPKSKTLIEEYGRIGSLTPHNVVLVPLGDDFRYEYTAEFDSQYNNYMKMFNYINSHPDLFNADVKFGTPREYFEAVKERQKSVPTLKGDFFVYSEIFSEGKPAYWSGYFTTRPYIKILARQLEHQLRTSEILFTLVSNHVKQQKNPKLVASEKRLEKSYEQLINSRRNLGLFQHHDAITGTSKASVMYDYGSKLFASLYHSIRIQEAALAIVTLPNSSLHSQNILQSETEFETYGKPPRKLKLMFFDKKKLILFNPLAQVRTEVINVRTNTTNVRVLDMRTNEYVQYQISPNIDVREDGRRTISNKDFDLLFVATLPALTAVAFHLEVHTNTSQRSIVFCNNCQDQNSKTEREDIFTVKKMMPGDIQLENSVLKLLINRNTGFLRQVYRKDIKKKHIVDIQFGAYQSAQRHSGAYLFMPDYDAPEKNVLLQYSNWNSLYDDNIIIVSGPISTEITTMYVPFLVHTARIYNVNDEALSRGVLFETIVDFESPPKNRETELFMRIQTDIQNGEIPEFYTDQNGFQYQKRVKVNTLGIEANYYPITTMAWLQDEETRLTMVTNHAQGAAAFEPGRIELMLDRRTLYDDYRGIGEGVVDNRPTVFHNWMLLESMSAPTRRKRDASEQEFVYTKERHFSPDQKESLYQLPSQAAEYLSKTLNYPVNIYMLDTSEVEEYEVKSHYSFVEEFPTGIHLVTLRTITDDILEQFPSSSCYMVLQRPGYSCSVGNTTSTKSALFSANTNFKGVNITALNSVSLTGLKTFRSLDEMSEITLEPMEVKTYKVQF